MTYVNNFPMPPLGLLIEEIIDFNIENDYLHLFYRKEDRENLVKEINKRYNEIIEELS